MVIITPDLAAFTQVSSRGRTRQGGKGERNKSIVLTVLFNRSTLVWRKEPVSSVPLKVI